MLLDKGISILG